MDNDRMFVSLLKKIGVKLSLNDPQWGRGSQDKKGGKKPNDGPPDIEDLWNEFKQGLVRLFGLKQNSGGSGDGDNSNSSGAKIGLGIVVAAVAFLWIVSGFFIVQEGQTGVVTTFGKFSHATSPGFNFHWPYPFQAREIVNVSQVQTVEVGYRGNSANRDAREALMLTDDENIIDIQFAVQFKLKSAADWIFNNREKEAMIKQVAETSIREIVGKSKMDFVLYESREKIAQDVKVLMQKILDSYFSGVEVINITMRGVQPPEQVQAAFDDAVKAGQDKIRQKNEGQAYANDVIPKAQGEASRILQEAEAYKSRIVANAEGNAARFKQVLVEYQKAPAVTRDRLYLETMQQIFSSTSKVILDAKTGSNVLYLPLDKLISQNADNTAVKVTSPTPVTPATESIPSIDVRSNRDARARETRDSRDREVR